MAEPELLVKREAVQWRDRAVGYRIYLDEREVASIQQGETWKGSCSVGDHTLSVRVSMYGSPNWLTSRTIAFTLEEGEVQQFRCHPRKGTWRWLLPEIDMTFARKGYITLEKVGSLD